MLHETMKSVARRLPTEDFIRIHRSTIVRFPFIKRVVRENGHWIAYLKDGTKAPVARSHVLQTLDVVRSRAKGSTQLELAAKSPPNLIQAQAVSPLVNLGRSQPTPSPERGTGILRHGCRRRAFEQAPIDKFRCGMASEAPGRNRRGRLSMAQDHDPVGAQFLGQYLYCAARGHFRNSDTHFGGASIGKHTGKYPKEKFTSPSGFSRMHVRTAAGVAETTDEIGRCGAWIRRSFRQSPHECRGKTKSARNRRKGAPPCRVSGPFEDGAGK